MADLSRLGIPCLVSAADHNRRPVLCAVGHRLSPEFAALPVVSDRGALLLGRVGAQSQTSASWGRRLLRNVWDDGSI